VLTDVPGSSAWLRSAFVTYSNEAKTEFLGVPEPLLERHGAVSEAVVRRMARGALSRARADVAVAVSGIAGPGGGSTDKPVGTVWFGLAKRRGRKVEVAAFVRHFQGNREAVRRCAVACALQAVLTP
jgi:nicotinamide-nucleotide amidase